MYDLFIDKDKREFVDKHCVYSPSFEYFTLSLVELMYFWFYQISTVDAFQGGEKDIIILSCVRTDHIGFIDCGR